MKSLIVFVSHHGTTANVASQIAGRIGNAEIMDLRKHPNPDLSPYDCIILGASIHAGKISGRMRNFMRNNMVTLLNKKLGIFLCCMNEPSFKAQLEANFPEVLRLHSSTNRVVGGEFLFDRMSFFEKWIVRKISGIHETTSNLLPEAIQGFIHDLKQA